MIVKKTKKKNRKCKKCVIKQKLKFEDGKHCLEVENKINQQEKNK